MKIREYLWPALAFLVSLAPLLVPFAPEPHPLITVAAAAWVGGLLVLARTKPEWALVLTAPVYAVNNLWAMTITVFVVFAASRRIRRLGRLWLLLLVTAVLQTGFGLLQQSVMWSMSGAEIIWGAVFGTVFMLFFPALSGMMLGRRKPMVRLLKERNEYLERARALTATSARSEERAHIAGEMHDMLGHRLSLISIHAGALELSTAKKAPELHEQAELIRTTSTIAMAELREILGVLRTNPEPDSLDEDTGTRTDITNLVEASKTAGLIVGLDWDGKDLHHADPRTRRAVHRVVREALTNVHKHAPTARTRIHVNVHNGHAQIQVVNSPSDTGQGKGTRRGLIGLEERVGLLGGAFSAGPPPEGGFRVIADIPLHPAPQPEQGAATEVPEVPPPLAAEVLTVPRVIGGGCLGFLAVVPITIGLVGLLLLGLFSSSTLQQADYQALQVDVTNEDDIVVKHGVGKPGLNGCSRYQAAHDEGLFYELCFKSGILSSKSETRP